MKRISIALTFAVSGCGNMDPDPTAGLPILAACQSGSTGTCVSFDPDVDQSIFPAEFYDASFRTVSDCMSQKFGFVTPPAPFVHVVNGSFNGLDGFAKFHEPLITVNGDPLLSGFPKALQHEFVHYILGANNYPDDLNKNHEHPGFLEKNEGCTRLTVV